jgi:hypothetical protein
MSSALQPSWLEDYNVRRLCSTERQVSGAAKSGSDAGADAVRRRLQTLVRLVTPTTVQPEGAVLVSLSRTAYVLGNSSEDTDS